MDEFILKPIGTVQNNIHNRKEMVALGVPSTIKIKEKYQDALLKLEENSHLIVMCYFHEARRETLRVFPQKFGLINPVEKGVFATRSPDRPNPVSLTMTRILKVHNDSVDIERIDAINGTPVIDLKPYSVGTENIFNTNSVNNKTDFTRVTDEKLSEYLKAGLFNYVYNQDTSIESGISCLIQAIRKLKAMPDREMINYIHTDFTGNALDLLYYYGKFTPGEGKITVSKGQTQNSFVEFYLQTGESVMFTPVHIKEESLVKDR
jgi:tRNA-Thr(GGU) m(6)t(6)A37 methyltransferase TsaA